MKIKLLALLCIALLSVTAKAQNGRLSLGAELAMPIGDFADQSNLGVGGSLRYEHPLGDKLSLPITAGVISFGGEEVTVGSGNFMFKMTTTSLMIPVQVGLKYYTMDMMNSFYVDVETGIHLHTFNVETEMIENGNSIKTDETDSEVNFGIAPGIGFHMANFDIGVRYQMIFVTATVTSTNPVTMQTITTESSTTYSYIGLRLAYVFGGN